MGIWNYSLRRASAISLRRFNNEGDRSSKEHLEEIMKSFDSQSRALAGGGATVLESGTVKINTKYGGHVTASAVLDVLMERKRRRNEPETEAEVRHLKSLASERAVRRLCLNETREARRVSASARAVCGSLKVCNAENISARKND
ncbi:hypothetical protein BWQ96_07281 [Gracilariopsis chorda]|uniref:Uncharacterized protein n=1 Tax=Gracilariopsis chorda TaxID=448386 RepID=A0A2V3ILQ3_9FLOR|nr:hypothetical protein BWQ96_07281 [Gracilariopsis chorda]|eukprot:PXF42977.1 hypothetical protein BWQ96_07281 [Gracilariopsis chorda]